MKSVLTALIALVLLASGAQLQARNKDQNKPSESAQEVPVRRGNFVEPRQAPAPVRERRVNKTERTPITLNQVERQTGGKVIGARPVSVQGRQLNQIKVQMPNGRVVIHQRLFDENGRSVDTVQEEDDDSDYRSIAADH